MYASTIPLGLSWQVGLVETQLLNTIFFQKKFTAYIRILLQIIDNSLLYSPLVLKYLLKLNSQLKWKAYKSSYVRSIPCERESSTGNEYSKTESLGNSGRYCEIRYIRIKSGGMCYFLQVLENIEAHMDGTGPVVLRVPTGLRARWTLEWEEIASPVRARFTGTGTLI